MATQRALLVQEIGKPLVLVHDRLIPEAGQGQVQIKVTVAGKSRDAEKRDCFIGLRLLTVALMLTTYNRVESS